MHEMLNVIKNRRSIRKFDDKPVSEEMIALLLEAVQWSPSWANTQCWEVVIVKDVTVKEKLQNTMLGKNPAAKAVGSAPVVLAICGKTKRSGYYKNEAPTMFGDWMLFDLGIVTQSLCLTAQAMGLGSVIVGLFEHAKAKKILNLPASHEVVVLIPIGHPAQHPSAPKRRGINEFSHTDTF